MQNQPDRDTLRGEARVIESYVLSGGRREQYALATWSAATISVCINRLTGHNLRTIRQASVGATKFETFVRTSMNPGRQANAEYRSVLESLTKSVRQKVERPGTRALAVKLCSVLLNLEPDRQLPLEVRKALFEGGDALATPEVRTAQLMEHTVPRVSSLISNVYIALGITENNRMRSPAIAIEKIMSKTNHRGERALWRTTLLNAFSGPAVPENLAMPTSDISTGEDNGAEIGGGVPPPTAATTPARPITAAALQGTPAAEMTMGWGIRTVPRSPPHVGTPLQLELPTMELVQGPSDISVGGLTPLFSDGVMDQLDLESLFGVTTDEHSAAQALHDMSSSGTDSGAGGAVSGGTRNMPPQGSGLATSSAHRAQDHQDEGTQRVQPLQTSVMELTAGGRQQQPAGDQNGGDSAQNQIPQLTAPPNMNERLEPPITAQGDLEGLPTVGEPSAVVHSHPAVRYHPSSVRECVHRCGGVWRTVVDMYEAGGQRSDALTMYNLLTVESEVQALHTAALMMSTELQALDYAGATEQGVRAGHLQALATILLGHVRLWRVNLHRQTEEATAAMISNITQQLETIGEWAANDRDPRTRRQPQLREGFTTPTRPILRRQSAHDVPHTAGVMHSAAIPDIGLPLMSFGTDGEVQLTNFWSDSDGQGTSVSATAAAAAAIPAYFRFSSSEGEQGSLNWRGERGSPKRRRTK